MLDDELSLELLMLFLILKEKSVCETDLWRFIAKESGLELKDTSFVKLLYIKYLVAIDSYLDTLVSNRGPNLTLSDAGPKIDWLVMEFGPEVDKFLSEIQRGNDVGWYSGLNSLNDAVSKNNNLVVDEEESMLVDASISVRNLTAVGQEHMVVGEHFTAGRSFKRGKTCQDSDNLISDVTDTVNCCNNDTDNMMVETNKIYSCQDTSFVDSDVSDVLSPSPKCACKSFSGVLRWLLGIATNPCDLTISPLPDVTKWDSCGNDEPWKQLFYVRKALFVKRHIGALGEKSLWQKYKMHPSIYDDDFGTAHSLRTKLVCGISSSVRELSQRHTCSQASSSGTPEDTACCSKASHGNSIISSKPSILDLPLELHVPVGPDFQAAVPEWTGADTSIDPKWMGTRVWPLTGTSRNSLTVTLPVGKGRHDSCRCKEPNSPDCVRFHSIGERARLRCELGAAFDEWGLHKTGEDVKFYWGKEEEDTFHKIMKSRPASTTKCMWNDIRRMLPKKRREDIISYYFNVFLLQRMAIQNRYSPENIDSDDDESDFSFLSNNLKNRKIKSSNSILSSAKKARRAL